MKRVRIFQVDAFASRPFEGNPAAVCLLPVPRDAAWMQQMAAEMNLSETAFLSKEGIFYRLRWFTPSFEVDLCGHATLASAHILWEEGLIAPDKTACFKTRSGILSASKAGESIMLDFPVEPERPLEAPINLYCALGIMPRYVGKNRFDYLIELDSEEMLRSLRPDFKLLATVEMRGVIVTCRSASSVYDFASRFFAPRLGIDEDPVTGSAHCCLGPFWQRRLKKDRMLAYQCSARGGLVQIQMKGERLNLGGQAVTIFRGEMD